MKKFRQLLATDLDGTLLRSDHTFSKNVIKELSKMEDRSVLRVIATGRSLYSLKKVVPENFPVDYIVFSSGAGIYNFKEKKIVKSIALEGNEIEEIVEVANKLKLNFSIQYEIPDNHKFLFIRNKKKSIDFENRIKIYTEFAQCIEFKNFQKKKYCQVIIISDKHDILLFNKLKKELSNFNVIRTTSPLNGKAIWIEIFPLTVSKALGIEYLRNKYHIKIENTFSIGNDYNDIYMLNYTANSFIVENGASELKEIYKNIKSNDNDGVLDVIKLMN